MTTLVTGAAGFIGFHLCRALQAQNQPVIGLDNFNSYYDVALKRARAEQLADMEIYNIDLIDKVKLHQLFSSQKITKVVNLAAQAGVRTTFDELDGYIQSNLVGFANILECSRHFEVEHLTYASSSSVYGSNTQLPFAETQNVTHPTQLYAATKLSNELMAHAYSHAYGLPTTGLRFFTVYGPWGRPDMALFKFTKLMLAGKPIQVYNYGESTRDFTYIDDIIQGVTGVHAAPPKANHAYDHSQPNAQHSSAPYRIFNIGNGQGVLLKDFISCLEEKLGVKANCEYLPGSKLEVDDTLSTNQQINEACGYKSTTNFEQGISKFVDWYRDYYQA